MDKVNEVNMAKWIVALRSQRYQQARGHLRGLEGGMCCLGVACEISGLGTWIDKGGCSGYATGAETDGPDAPSALLPDAVVAWLGVGYRNPRVRVGPDLEIINGERALSGLNDDLQWNFRQIAEAVEDTYLPGKKAEEILAEAK